jgi:hypothetical protein
MSDLTASSFRRLYTTAQNRLRETMADELASTIDDLQDKLLDARAQDLLDEIVVLAQGRDPAHERLQQVINFALSIADTENAGEEETESGAKTGVELTPTTNDHRQK